MYKIKGKKINPAGSNRMLWAVGGGLTLVFLLLGFLLFYQKEPASEREAIGRSLGYLNKTEGIISVVVETEPTRVIIVYDSNFSKDYSMIAHYAAVRLAPRVDDAVVELARNTPGEVERRIVLRGGAIVSETQTGE